ncbi:MAG: glutamine--fructose-6-phosphate transaminase (isomerizing), partial [Gammaproteobacteria bacterium]|nr:glutamine--fructose-6-phosphate transaminase (isomerizing) [Gammaproteobacteria bacterium]
MCGIVGAIAGRDVVPLLVEGLQRLEYRGYDSAGVAVLNGGIRRIRTVGRVAELRGKAKTERLQGFIGIGHTRWATHGGVTEANAHPHVSRDELAVVHNGIIENHEQQRARLKQLGYEFESQTDTEVIAHLIHYHFSQSHDLFAALQKAVQELVGAYAIGALALQAPEVMVCARMGCPLLIGLGKGENFIASDVSAVLAATRRVVYLEDGDVAEVRRERVSIVDRDGCAVRRKIHESDVSLASMELGPYRHFMQKEIYEQPRALTDTIESTIAEGFAPALFGKQAAEIFRDLSAVRILAAGTSYYAGLTAKYWIESFAKLPVGVEIASEYRYSDSVADPRQLIITISQSGETLDTLEALKHAKALGHGKTLSICNVQESAIPRASELVFYTRAGAEIGVASTKAFTTQLAALFIFAVTLARQRGLLDEQKLAGYTESLRHVPGSVQHALNLEPQIAEWSKAFAPKQHALFLGRGIHYPIALEGALKLKEI